MLCFQACCEASQYKKQTRVIGLRYLYFDLDWEASLSKVGIKEILRYF